MNGIFALYLRQDVRGIREITANFLTLTVISSNALTINCGKLQSGTLCSLMPIDQIVTQRFLILERM